MRSVWGEEEKLKLLMWVIRGKWSLFLLRAAFLSWHWEM